MDDTAFLKTPTVVCHALDCRVVFAGEGHACQAAALGERPVPDARHAGGDRHACQTAANFKRPSPNARHAVSDRHTCQIRAVSERIFPDARHAVGDRHACQSTAPLERRIPDARHAGGDRHACQSTAFIERILPDARHIGSNFNSLRHFYPLVVIGIFSIQSGDFHRIQVYLSRPVIFLRSPVCERYLRLWVCGWF